MLFLEAYFDYCSQQVHYERLRRQGPSATVSYTHKIPTGPILVQHTSSQEGDLVFRISLFHYVQYFLKFGIIRRYLSPRREALSPARSNGWICRLLQNHIIWNECSGITRGRVKISITLLLRFISQNISIVQCFVNSCKSQDLCPSYNKPVFIRKSRLSSISKRLKICNYISKRRICQFTSGSSTKTTRSNNTLASLIRAQYQGTLMFAQNLLTLLIQPHSTAKLSILGQLHTFEKLRYGPGKRALAL